MIKRLDIQNFQSHKNTSLEFSPGVNTIIGPSDSGKTAIIRALKWAIWNRPLGDAFVSHWADETTVMIGTADGEVIERHKGKKDHYRLHSNEDVLEFKAFGTEPPEEIINAVNFSEINLQSQMDNSFLIANNSGEVSRHFNKIANIEKIDSSLKAVEKWVRSINQDIKATEDQIERYEGQLTEFDYLDKMEADVEALEGMEERRNNMAKDARVLEQLILQSEQTAVDMEELSEFLPLEEPVDHILALYDQRKQLHDEYGRLKTLGIDIYQTGKKLNKLKEFTKADDAIEALLKLHEERDELQSKQFSLFSELNRIEKLDDKLLVAEGIVEDLEQKWEENMPNICPLCDQKIE